MKKIACAVVVGLIAMFVYSCTSTCEITPPPGGLSYDEAGERSNGK